MEQSFITGGDPTSIDSSVFGIAVVVLLLLVFSDQISYLLRATKIAVVSMITGKGRRLSCGCTNRCEGHRSSQEHLSDPPHSAGDPDLVVGSGSDALDALGYADGGNMPWSEMIKVSDLDGSVHRNHNHFVADVRRFSSGANFTSVADDNTNIAFTNFVGLRRPQAVAILPDARQQPDIDQTVLERNKPLVW